MTSDTINDAVTMAGGDGTLLANRYRIVKQLGQGGMGSVWLAEDTQLDNKPFAIKMLPSILVSNKRAYRQLKDEALVAMKLTHPNIVTLRAFEENNGNPFLVMDYIDGQTLDDYLAENGKMSEDETIRLLKPIAAALDYAHSKGVVHRDVKPGNVMVAKDGTPYILDFGIAREMQETMTRVTGKLSSGTLLYMSPEQLRGLPPKASQDVYSFAAMAYECLKGNPPFYRGAIEDQIKNEAPEPLSDVAGGSRFVAAVMAGLAKKPDDRPATCVGVLEERVSAQSRREAEPQREDSPSQRAQKSNVPSPEVEPPRNSSGVGKVLAVVAMAICGIVFFSTQCKSNRELGHSSMQPETTYRPSVGSEKTLSAQKEKTLTLPGGAKMEMIYVGPGSFMMGSPESEDGRDNDETQHRVTLTKGFWLGKYEVTQSQWQSVMGDNPSNFKSPDRPVERVSWEDCQQFIQKVNASAKQQLGGGARLPTEAEWEYACRAGTTTAYYWGNALNGDKANYDGNNPCGTTAKGQFKGETTSVGSYGANPWGFFDMHGNVYEWCQDWYGSYNVDATDPQGPASGGYRVLRGGGWNSNARYCRSAGRDRGDPGFRYDISGFRLCCSAGPRE